MQKWRMELPAQSPDQQAANRLFLASKDMEEVLRYLDAYAELDEMQKARGDSMFSITAKRS